MNTLGFNKEPSETTVVVAMSGGVDSSVVAGLLKQEGYNVIGITLQLYSSNTSAKKGSCCSGIDIYDARRVAQKLDIPHYVFNYEKTFKEDVIDYFINAYENGETPIPCVKCNETVKFRDLMNFAKKLDADGCHLGQKDMKIREARKLLNNKIIGVTCHNSLKLAKLAIKNKADYVAFGAFNSSKTKKVKYKANVSLIKKLKKLSNIPVIAIGGINDSNYEKLLLNKADFLAISGYIWNNNKLKPLEAIKKLK